MAYVFQRVLPAAVLALAACAPPAAGPAAPATQERVADDAFLDGFAGDWMMDGQVMGETARYRAHGERVLDGAWLEFHMTDANKTPPEYEARVFIGWDNEAHDYVAHWLDDFGAGGARVAATGRREENTLTIDYPYANGVFRNIWVREEAGWTLTIEAHQPDGSWRNFAHYQVRRAA